MDGVDNAGFAATVVTVGELQGTANISFPVEGSVSAFLWLDAVFANLSCVLWISLDNFF
jgi:hypothetical protein